MSSSPVGLHGLTREGARKLREHIAHVKRRRHIEARLEGEETALDAAADDFTEFVDVTHPNYQRGPLQNTLAACLQWVSDEVLAGRSPRVIVELPPRSGKTVQISHRLPVWHQRRAAAQGLQHEVILSSYSASLAHSNSRAARAIARDLARHWPELGKLQGGADSAEQWQIANGASVHAAGVTGPLTGKGADLAIVDDPIKDMAEADSAVIREKVWVWLRSVLMTRIAPGGGIIVLMTRWHEDDPVGRILGKLEGWHRVRLPAVSEEDETETELVPGVHGWRDRPGLVLDPARFGDDAMAAKRDEVGERVWLALYQQRPTATQGKLYRREWFEHRYAHDPQRPPTPYDDVCISIDANFKDIKDGDPAAVVVFGRWHEHKPYPEHIADVLGVPLHESVDFPDLLDAVMTSIRVWHPHRVLIEDKANGSALIASLNRLLGSFCRRHGLRRPAVLRAEDSWDGNLGKWPRAQIAAPYWRTGGIRLPEHAPWVDGYTEEHIGAGPGAKLMDRVDATSQYVIDVAEGGGVDVVQEARAHVLLFGG